jgi:hypothetical protein
VSRFATLRNRLVYDNANTYTVLGGDLYSPSALSGVDINSTYGALNGRQMVVCDIIHTSHPYIALRSDSTSNTINSIQCRIYY